jgi:nitroimidazol reductase NimA-like FMN-containing flavoprotein (pyridoxamine 5'-phosphate oxidase superfamily)
MRPRARRLSTPGYGFEEVARPGEALGWEEVERLLTTARTYWVATTRAGGRPHVAPVWGVWLEGRFVFETSSASVKARNLLARPDCVVHIDHTEAAVILEGRAEVTTDEGLLRRFVEAYEPKYDWKLEPYLVRPVSRTFVVRPSVVISFKEYLGKTSTRWELG